VTGLLRQGEGVRDAATIVRSTASGGELISFVVGDPDLTDLRTRLTQSLPEAMVPASITVLDALPVTTSGKLDRAALASLTTLGECEVAREAVPAATEAEALVLGVFVETLGDTGLGVTDSFFAYGGNSLIAVRVVTRLRDRAGIDLPVSAVFEQPSARRLAGALERAIEAEIAAMSDDQVEAALGGDGS
jgi:Phosphopantetheine attachment site/AMP-binding enzyme C-terminal domain